MFKNPDFANGITNGADWYIVNGGMQDWNYVYAGCMELTLELSCEKWPPIGDMTKYWEENKVSLIEFSKQGLRGIRGYIYDKADSSPVYASIQILSRSFKVYSDPLTGRYFRILLPGAYDVQVLARDYHPVNKSILIKDEYVRVDFELDKLFPDVHFKDLNLDYRRPALVDDVLFSLLLLSLTINLIICFLYFRKRLRS